MAKPTTSKKKTVTPFYRVVPDQFSQGEIEAIVHERGEFARIEFDVAAWPRQIATREDEGGFVTVSPTESLGLKFQRGLIGP